MFCTSIYHQITVLLDPAKLQADTVQNLHFLVRFNEIVEASLKTLVFAKLGDRSCIRTVDKCLFRKSPFFAAFLQEINEFYRRVRRCQRF